MAMRLNRASGRPGKGMRQVIRLAVVVVVFALLAWGMALALDAQFLPQAAVQADPTYPPQGEDVVQAPGQPLVYAQDGDSMTGLSSCTAEGYASETSVLQGGAIDFHISSDCSDLDLYIFREGATQELVRVIQGVTAGKYPCSHGELGCAWPVAYTLEIPRNWRSGLYAVQLFGPGDVIGAQDNYILFVVREDMPGSTARILVQFSTNTWQAYNAEYGLDFYTTPRAMEISYDRPYTKQPYGEGPYAYEIQLVRWLESHGYPAEYCTNVDLQFMPASVLDQYPVFVSMGHDEYWSKEMRDNLEAYIGRGGNAIFFSSNTCYWQARMEDAGHKIVCYKDDFYNDPLYGVDNSRVTYLWSGPPVNRPENYMTGVKSGYIFAAGGYRIYNSNHWVFAGTGLLEGAVFGEEGNGLQAPEADGAGYQFVGGKPVPTGADGSPLNYVILGIASKIGPTTMGIYQRNGEVFTTGSWNWAKQGLATGNFYVEQITKNVLNRFTQLDAAPTPTPWATPTAEPRATTLTLQQGLNAYTGVTDTYVHSWYPSNNYASSGELLLRPGDVVRPLIKFDLGVGTTIPADAHITKATLSFYALGSTVNLLVADLRKVLVPWVDTQATWARRTSTSNWNVAGCGGDADRTRAIYDSERMYTINGWYTFNVTNLVQEWVDNPSSNLGVILSSSTQTAVQYNLASSQNNTQFFRPKLIISYVRETPAPTATPTRTATATPTRTQTPTATATPTPVKPSLVSPNSGWSLPDTLQQFTAKYEDAKGWQDIRYAYIMINVDTTPGACVYARYNVQTNQMYFYAPTGVWRGPRTPGEGLLQHIYGTLDTAQSSVTASGNTLTITWAIGFAWRNSGKDNNIYLSMEDMSGNVEAWHDEGDWTVNRLPNWLIPPTSLSPILGTAYAGEPVYFDPAYRDLDGKGDLKELYFLIADQPPSDTAPDDQIPQGVYLKYVNSEATPMLYIWGDDGWIAYEPRSSSGTASNPVVTRGARAFVITQWSYPIVADVKTLKILWRLGFNANYVGQHKLYMRAIDVHGGDRGGDTGWKYKGYFNVAVREVPTETATPTATSTNPSAPSPTPTVTSTATETPTPVSGIVRVRIEAESGTITGPMAIYQDSTASGCSYVASPSGGDETCAGGSVVYDFYIPREDNYFVATRVKASYAHNKFWVSMDGGTLRYWQPPYIGSGSEGLCDSDGWCYDMVSHWGSTPDDQFDPLVFHLTQGTHTLRFCAGLSDTRLDLFDVTTIYDFDTTIDGCTVIPTPDVAGSMKDTYISSWAPTTNYGNDWYIKVRSDDAMAGLLRPDLSNIASNAVVTSAKLKLYVYASGGNPMTLLAYRVNRPWVDTQANWTLAATGSPWATAGGLAVPADHDATLAASAPVSAANVWVELDLTTLAQGWVADPAHNYGVILKGTGNSAVLYTLLSTQYLDATKRPQFEISYYTP